MESTPKKVWEPPKVQRYGTFEAATKGCDKMYGGSDGFMFQGVDIVCAS
jgi:hypothetical protein